MIVYKKYFNLQIGYFKWAQHIASVRYEASRSLKHINKLLYPEPFTFTVAVYTVYSTDPSSIEAKADLDLLKADMNEKFAQGLSPRFTPTTWRKPDLTDTYRRYEALCRGDTVSKVNIF